MPATGGFPNATGIVLIAFCAVIMAAAGIALLKGPGGVARAFGALLMVPLLVSTAFAVGATID